MKSGTLDAVAGVKYRQSNFRQMREIRHLRHVKERIRAKIRELRELPTS
jgi:hypothetical protein